MILLNWLYPPTCMGCDILLPLNDKRRTAIWLCAACEDLFEPAEPPPKRPTRTVRVENHACFAYEGILRDIIRGIKFRGKKNHARALGHLWGDHIKNAPPSQDDAPLLTNTILVPVPLHAAKERARGFNQATLLAEGLARALHLPMEQTLTRVVDTPPQAGLHPARRVENVTDAFEITKDCTPGEKMYILVDDIYTTGASLDECARTLLTHGARSVKAMTLTATARRSDPTCAAPH